MPLVKNTVVIIEDSSKAKFGGGQQVSLILASILSEFYYLILFDTNNNSVFFKKALQYFDENRKLISFGKIQSGFLGMFYKFIECFTFPLLLVINICLIYQRFKNDKNVLIYTSSKKSLIYAYFCKILFNIDFIYHAHLVERNVFILFFYKKFLNSANKIIVTSEIIKNNIALSNVIKMYNPVTSSIPGKPKMLKTKIVVGAFGSLIKIKGTEYFIKSYSYLKLPKDIKIEFHIFGVGPEKKGLLKYSSEHIIFRGFIKDIIPEMLQNIDILCFPTIIEEACPVTIIEALSCGIPVITTNIGGQAELVKDGYNGFWVPIKNSSAIADKIDFLMNNPIEYSNFSKNALNSLDPFSIETFKEKILDIFKDQRSH